MTAAIARARAEQVQAATLLLAGGDQRGLRLYLADWVAEEILIMAEMIENVAGLSDNVKRPHVATNYAEPIASAALEVPRNA